MAQPDLFELLKGFAAKGKSPYIDIKEFIVYVEKIAEKKSKQDRDWIDWAINTDGLFQAKIPALVEDGLCILIADSNEGRIFIPPYCREQIEEAYRDIDKLAAYPFPSEQSLKLNMPDGFARTINLSFDMGLFFDKSEASPDPAEIILLQFPQSYGSALLMASMIPRKLMEVALLMIRNFLHSRNNKDYVQNKLANQMQGREKVLRDLTDRIMVRPLDCLDDMERSADFPYLFWTCFCPLVKNDIHKKNELLADDIAVLQAVSIIEVCCSFYRSMSAKRREVDAALMTLDAQMDRFPWLFTLEEIVGFTNDRGVPLLDIYSQQDLEEYIKKAISEGKGDTLPRWLVLRDEKRSVRWFVKKERYLSVCSRMLYDTQQRIKETIIKRWTRLMLDYAKEPAMEKDDEFERLLEKQTYTVNPDLLTMLKDSRLMLVYEEMSREQGTAFQSSLLFKDGRLLPFGALYALSRRELLYDVKLKLPFWFSIPFIVAIIAFFRNLGFKPKAADQIGENDDGSSAVNEEPDNFRNKDIRRSARLIQAELVPPGKTLDEYLAELEERWLMLLNKKARENLLDDVQALLRDNLRSVRKVYKLKRITLDGLQEMIDILISRNPALKSLNDQESLHLYMELYTLKLFQDWFK